MARLIDSSVIIAWERRGRPIDDLLSRWRSEDIAVATITISELLVGVHRAAPGRRRDRRFAVVNFIADHVPVLPFDLRSAQIHAQIFARLLEQGQPIGLNDTLIAAVAMAHGYSVVTDNVRHFALIDGLTVEHPAWSH